MNRRGLILLLTMALLTGFVLPLPECYLTKLNCPRRGDGSCMVFAKDCEPAKSGCGQACPLAQSRGEQEKPKKCCEHFQKLKSYPVRSLVGQALDIDRAFIVVADVSLAARDAFQTGSLTTSVNKGERASPILLQKQSFLF